MKTLVLTAAFLAATASWLAADSPKIESVKASKQSNGQWRFDVTLRHADTGWDDYADGWRVLGLNGTELGFRELLHPHVNEQPFTRSLSNVAIPQDVTQVQVEARDNVGGWSGAPVLFALPD